MGCDTGAIIVVFLGFVSLLTVLACLPESSGLHPELLRKCVHVVMGFASCSFLWLFKNPLSVLILAIIISLVMQAIRQVPVLRSCFGHVLCGVKRRSLGDFAYAAGVAVLFMIGYDEPVFYCLSVLTLTFSDTVSALWGTFAGRHFYNTIYGGIKTWEGSLAFFLSTVILITGGLCCFSATPPASALAIAYLVAGFGTLAEAVSYSGLDNFFIPVVTYLLLHTYADLSLPGLLARAVTATCIVVLILLSGHQEQLRDGIKSALGRA